MGDNILANRHDEGGYEPGVVVPFPTRPWPPSTLPPCYLPSDGQRRTVHNAEEMADATGNQPIINRYSITKYYPDDWKHHNAMVLEGQPIRNANRLEVEAKECLKDTYGIANREFAGNTDFLKKRAYDVFHWKAETEYSIKAMTEEISMLEQLRQRFKTAIAILIHPENIAKECLDLRSNRIGIDLVHDLPEEELLAEVALIIEVRHIYEDTMKQVEIQLKNNKAAKAKVEFDWSDKVVSYDTESVNVHLNKKSDIILMRPGSVRIPEEQSSMMHWEDFTKKNIEDAEIERQNSMSLRKYTESLLIKASRDLRIQAERVDQALEERARCTDELRIRLEDEMTQTLEKLKIIETLPDELNAAIRRMEISIKVAQTRLDNRQIVGRPNVENCRDVPQCGLLEEVKRLTENIHLLKEKLYQANQVRVGLLKSRSEIEREICIKKKSISIDRDRCKTIRSFYPSASQLSGNE